MSRILIAAGIMLVGGSVMAMANSMEPVLTLPPLYFDHPAPMVILPSPPKGPAFEPASSWPPCAFCSRAINPMDNPANDLMRYEDMNPTIMPVRPNLAPMMMD
jgi:hypothetical protein